MLDAFIIEEIRRRERTDDRLQPRLERPDAFPLPLPPEPDPYRGYNDDDDDDNNGVIIIDM
ncbi:MAG: hypothetical protein KC502_06460 [Myxococcales bacterium]|nr:hypothetical protein [Myxococcales bacterium]